MIQLFHNRTIVRLLLILSCLLAPWVAGGANCFDLYGSLTGKTVLRPSSAMTISKEVLSGMPMEKTNAIAWLEKEYSKLGLAVVPDGPHFVVILPKVMCGSLTNEISLHGAKLAAADSSAPVVSGMISLRAVEVSDMLKIYAALSGRTVLRPVGLYPIQFALENTCPLNREETAYALATVLALNDVAVVADGAKFAQVVQVADLKLIKTNAPVPGVGEALLDPNQVPSIGVPERDKPMTQMERNVARWRKVVSDFFRFKQAKDRTAGELLDLYAGLSGMTALPSKDCDPTQVWFQMTTPVTRTELLYSIETTFALEKLKIAQVDKQKIQLDRIPQEEQKKRKN